MYGKILLALTSACHCLSLIILISGAHLKVSMSYVILYVNVRTHLSWVLFLRSKLTILAPLTKSRCFLLYACTDIRGFKDVAVLAEHLLGLSALLYVLLSLALYVCRAKPAAVLHSPPWWYSDGFWDLLCCASINFIALTLLVGWQEEHLACKNEWSGAGMVISL